LSTGVDSNHRFEASFKPDRTVSRFGCLLGKWRLTRGPRGYRWTL
jgi:hypothetical protein